MPAAQHTCGRGYGMDQRCQDKNGQYSNYCIDGTVKRKTGDSFRTYAFFYQEMGQLVRLFIQLFISDALIFKINGRIFGIFFCLLFILCSGFYASLCAEPVLFENRQKLLENFLLIPKMLFGE